MPQILVVDDDRAICLLAQKALSSIADVETAESAISALRMLHHRSYDAVLLDIVLPDQSGLALYCQIRELDQRLPVVFMTAESTSDTVIEAMQLGAFDFLTKPLAVKPLRQLIEKAIRQKQMGRNPAAITAHILSEGPSDDLIIGSSDSMLEVFKSVGRISQQDVPVLIYGESGTGKELVAKALYRYSKRYDYPFLAVNCAALPDNLLESELFGHERGAFTGADTRRIGKFEQCNRGTLFLDEIGDMAPMVQAKVLRVLQNQTFERVGGNNTLTTDVRIIAATNRPLEKMVKLGEYREDLLYRLNGVTITLPPLRQREGDVELLIQHFLNQAKRDFGKTGLKGMAPQTVDLLKQYSWPGNVRQLRAVIRRSVLDSVMPIITPDELPSQIRPDDSAVDDSIEEQESDFEVLRESEFSPMPDSRSQHNDSEGGALPALVTRLLELHSDDVYSEVIEYVERYLLLRILRHTQGNQSQAAELLGITRGKLRDRIATYQIVLENDVTVKNS